MTAKTVITLEEKPFDAPIEYTFKGQDGDIKIIEAQNTAEARRKLNKLTGYKPGYKLIQRRI